MKIMLIIFNDEMFDSYPLPNINRIINDILYTFIIIKSIIKHRINKYSNIK